MHINELFKHFPFSHSRELIHRKNLILTAPDGYKTKVASKFINIMGKHFVQRIFMASG
jgi:ABC-type transport system involved in Fe-S cluster assembly fused permease/ATPase subunit